MLAEIKSSTGVDATLISGSGGIFDVKRDDAVIFSKRQLGRFPKVGEITAILTNA